MKFHTYINFEGRCEEAIKFYQRVLGAEVISIMRGKDAPEGAGCGPVGTDKVMHASVKIGGTEVMMSDGMNSGNPEFKGITCSLSLDNDEQVQSTFAALSEDGHIFMDVGETFFASSWGVCSDKFGVNWMVLAPVPVPV